MSGGRRRERRVRAARSPLPVAPSRLHCCCRSKRRLPSPTWARRGSVGAAVNPVAGSMAVILVTYTFKAGFRRCGAWLAGEGGRGECACVYTHMRVRCVRLFSCACLRVLLCRRHHNARCSGPNSYAFHPALHPISQVQASRSVQGPARPDRAAAAAACVMGRHCMARVAGVARR